MEKGNLSINSENILPIIKKWLYSDMDIFLRELISNGCDAVSKLKKLKSLGEAPDVSDDENFYVKVILDEKNKTITVSDNGIGMTGEEIKKYINQIAFSGAGDFIEKYKERMSDTDGEIIGHFGLGFYSAFMVSDTVEIDSLSYAEESAPAKWVSDGGIEYELSQGAKNTRGTDIVLHISDESREFLSQYKLKEIMKKYCAFMPIPIYFEKLEEPGEPSDNQDSDEEQTEQKSDPPVNDTNPLWLKPASECTDEEYKDFYHKVFMDFEDPLFWIHLNMDYPFRLKGILYFPKLKNQYETLEGQVKLYCNQVFVADNVKEVIPEFLLLLKGTIDCPDIPLNVSRSFLQNDSNVTKMSGYITRKVADKLNSLYKKDSEEYIKYWDDISVFIKYGCIKDRSFYEKIENSVIYKTINGDYKNLPELLGEANSDEENSTPEPVVEPDGESPGKTVYYVSDTAVQSQYISLFKESGLEAVILNHTIDTPFISFIESYKQGMGFKRIDSDIDSTLVNESDKEDNSALESLFKQSLENENLKVEAQSLKNENTPAIIVLSEQSRRWKEMSKMYANAGSFPTDEKLILNKNNNLVKALAKLSENDENKDEVNLIASQIYDLAQMSQKPFEADEMSRFIERSNKILGILAQSKLGDEQ